MADRRVDWRSRLTSSSDTSQHICGLTQNILFKFGEGFEKLEDLMGFNSKILDLGLAKSLSWGCGEKKRESQEVQGKFLLAHGVKKNGTPPYKKKEKKRRNE
ncbi:hypothetical protein H5410_063888 [Solanum commersonii]|uniref:Uncharacterized protein n=1 Tax=Solanum commersonii TaxID=4109 RepID=A0A9J5WES9_SOLCO|nr:hypothetical protein H5410_063888 [Solanum commersonii]